MRYPSYTTPLTEQNFIAADSLLSTTSAADEYLVALQGWTPSRPAFSDPKSVPAYKYVYVDLWNSLYTTSDRNSSYNTLPYAGHAKDRFTTAFTSNEYWKSDSLLLCDWSNVKMVALPEESAVAPVVLNSVQRSITEWPTAWPAIRRPSERFNRYMTTFIEDFGLRLISITPAFSSKYLSDQQLFDAVRSLLLNNNERDRRIADRLTTLYQDALSEGQSLLPDSIKQFVEFFLSHNDLGMPKITLTPDGTVRARWIHGKSNFAAIEFTGRQAVKFVAEIPRARGVTARYFSSESIESVLPAAIALGSSFS
jgi:hypothetical protein